MEVSEAGTYCKNDGVIPTKSCHTNDFGYRSGKKANYTRILMLGAGNLGIGGGRWRAIPMCSLKTALFG